MSDKRYDYIDKEIIERIEYFRSRGHRVPKLSMIKTPEQIEGIRASGVINTGVLDLVASEIHAGMSTLEIDKLVHDYTLDHGAVPAPLNYYTLDHGAVPAPLNYEGFPKSVCTSINEVVCHGIPNEFDILEEGDIINVDVSTIYNGYYSDASRMFVIGAAEPRVQRLVDVARPRGAPCGRR